jgi:hypothetical protein
MAQVREAHPLVIGLLETLADDKLQIAIKNAGPIGIEEVGDFGARASGAQIRAFAGYLGGLVKDPKVSPDSWRVLFTDIDLANWLLFKDDDILHSERLDDEMAAGGKRDYVWVKSDALVCRGDPSSDAKAVVLSGSFTRAGDLATSLRGDTSARRGGLLLDATTPVCCGGNSRH